MWKLDMLMSNNLAKHIICCKKSGVCQEFALIHRDAAQNIEEDIPYVAGYFPQ